MILQSITKGNLNLELTKNTYKHENNLRFHIQIDGRYYEYTTCTINKGTVNLQCVVHKKKKCNGNDGQQRCLARITMTVGGRLKTQEKACNSKKPKYEWSDKNDFQDYFDVRNYAIQKHYCQKFCQKRCTVKHSCSGHELSRDRKRTFVDIARNHNLANPILESTKSTARAEEVTFPEYEFEGQNA